MPHKSVNQIEPHEVQIIRRGEVEHSSRLADAVHFAHGRARVRNVLDRFAGDDHIKRIVVKGHLLRIGLNVGNPIRQ